MANKDLEDLIKSENEKKLTRRSFLKIGLGLGALITASYMGLNFLVERGFGSGSIGLTKDGRSKTSACFVGDDKIVYSYRRNSDRLYMVELQNNKPRKPKMIFADWNMPEEINGKDTYYRQIMGRDLGTRICGVGDDKVVFPAILGHLRNRALGIFVYDIGKEKEFPFYGKPKDLRLIFYDDFFEYGPLELCGSKDEKRVILRLPKELTGEELEHDEYFAIPADTDITYSFGNLPPRASEEEVRYLKSIYERIYAAGRDESILDVRNDMVIKRVFSYRSFFRNFFYSVIDLIFRRGGSIIRGGVETGPGPEVGGDDLMLVGEKRK